MGTTEVRTSTGPTRTPAPSASKETRILTTALSESGSAPSRTSVSTAMSTTVDSLSTTLRNNTSLSSTTTIALSSRSTEFASVSFSNQLFSSTQVPAVSHNSLYSAPGSTSLSGGLGLPHITSSRGPSTTSTILDPSGTPTLSQPIVHTIVIDSGACANIGVPIVVDVTDGEELALTSLSDTLRSVSLASDPTGSGIATVSLSDSGERCRADGNTCAAVVIVFGPNALQMGVARRNIRGGAMYPFSFWADGGRLLDGTLADSEQHKYNCWGWSEADCRFADDDEAASDYGLTSNMPNATIHIKFCPPDGPAWASVGPNPTESLVVTHATQVVISTTADILTSTAWIPTRTGPTRIHGMMTVGTWAPAPTLTTEDDVTAFCRTATQTTCFHLMTQVFEQETTTIPLGTPFFATYLGTTTTAVAEPSTVFSTYSGHGTKTIVPVSTVMLTPTRPQDSSGLLVTGIPTTVTDSLGMPIATSTISAVVFPTVSAMTNDQGLVTSVGYNATATLATPSLTPPPEISYILTSWTTYSIVNGSTVSLIGAQLSARTTIGATYALLPGTVVPISLLSSISVESTRTSLPSSTAEAADKRSSKEGRVGTIAGIVIAILVLLGIIFWVIYLQKKGRRRAPDYAVHRPPIWNSRLGPGTGSVQGSSFRDGSMVDLNSEPQPRRSLVEPWVEERQAHLRSQKMLREMEEHGGGVSIPESSQIGARAQVGHAFLTSRSLKLANRGRLEQRAEPLARCPMHNDTLSSTHAPQESGPSDTSPHPLPPTPVTQSPNLAQHPAPARPPLPTPVRPQFEEPTEVPQDSAIPPLYNEAWNVPRGTLNE